ncbi:MAG: ATP-binding protein [Chloroflexota bacterium]|nr:ATP-binding protein [Chloroflexota bacterium]
MIDRPTTAALADALGIGLLTVDSADRVGSANAAAHELLHTRPGGIIGRSTIEVFVDHKIEALIALSRKGGAGRGEYVVPSTPATTLELTCIPADGDGVVVALRDVSELLRLRRIRSEFIDNLSHELRTPLTTMRLLAETLNLEAKRTELPQRITDGLGRIDLETSRLVQMVDELLDLAAIEAGETPLNLAPTDLGTVVDETLERLRAYADHHDVSLRADSPAEAAARTVPADASRIGQILVNVIDNAIRFSPAGGEVVVHVRPAQSEVVIEVEDQGEGIAHADLERIFERFYKGDRARSRGRGGTGLGLAIAGHIAERHGGRMWARSEPGKGAQLFLALPR